MKRHIKVYFDYFGYKLQSDIYCEVCGSAANDIHHIDCRGMGGSKLKDSIHNLMALCRKCHEKFGDKSLYKEYLIQIHQYRINIYNEWGRTTF